MKTRCPDLTRRTGQAREAYLCGLFWNSQDQRNNFKVFRMFDFEVNIFIVKMFFMKPTYNPSKLRRARKFGFRKRNQSASGRKVLKNRRQKGRASLTASVARRFK